MNNVNQEEGLNYLLKSEGVNGLVLVVKLYEYCVNRNKLNCFNAMANYYNNLFEFTEGNEKQLNELLEELVKTVEEELIERKDD